VYLAGASPGCGIRSRCRAGEPFCFGARHGDGTRPRFVQAHEASWHLPFALSRSFIHRAAVETLGSHRRRRDHHQSVAATSLRYYPKNADKGKALWIRLSASFYSSAYRLVPAWFDFLEDSVPILPTHCILLLFIISSIGSVDPCHGESPSSDRRSITDRSSSYGVYHTNVSASIPV
jgi:hypothetical protein